MAKFAPCVKMRIATSMQQPGEDAAGEVSRIGILSIDDWRPVKAQCDLRVICCADLARLAAGVVVSEDGIHQRPTAWRLFWIWAAIQASTSCSIQPTALGPMEMGRGNVESKAPGRAALHCSFA